MLAVAGIASAQPHVTEIRPPLGTFSNTPHGMSADGQVVVGSGQVSGSGRTIAYRWTAASGVQILPPLTGHTTTTTVGITANGRTILCASGPNAASFYTSFFRTETATQTFGAFDDQDLTSPIALSGDGSTIVGVQNNGGHAVRWTSPGGFVELPSPYSSLATPFAVSHNGQAVAGAMVDPNPPGGAVHAFVWKAGLGTQILSAESSQARAINGDGTVVVGEAGLFPQRAIRWVNGAAQELGNPGGAETVRARCVSADGRFVGGIYSVAGVAGFYAWIWTAETGIQTLSSYLTQRGVDVTGWEFGEVLGFSTDGLVIMGTGLHNAANRAFVVDFRKDSDGDGLCDDWETNGIPYLDEAGAVQRYPLPGANPLRKDLYVEVDSMTGFRPAQNAIDRVVAVFDQSPVPAVPGLAGGLPGITLHVSLDDTFGPAQSYVINAGWEEFHNDKVLWFGTEAERSASDRTQRLEAKAQAYRYCLFVKGIPDALGIAELDADGPGLGPRRGTNDFMIGLNSFHPPATVNMEDVQAACFMHELGHTLGLYHGGTSAYQNFNPNHYSVMNYMWAGVRSFAPAGQRVVLDYCRQSMPQLSEGSLSETAGIGGIGAPAGLRVPIYVRKLLEPSVCPDWAIDISLDGRCDAPIDAHRCVLYVPFSGKVDWDNDGVITPSPVCADPNGNTATDDTFDAPNEWLLLAYGFRDSPFFSDLINAPAVGPCPTVEFEEFLTSLPPPPPPVTCPVDPPVTGAVAPVSATSCGTGDRTASFTVAPTGTGPYQVQWRWRADGQGTPWNDFADGSMPDSAFIKGAHAKKIVIAYANQIDFGASTIRLSCRVTDVCDQTSESAEAVLFVEGPTLTAASPLSVAGCPGGTASFSVAASGTTGPFQYSWTVEDPFGFPLSDGPMVGGTVVTGTHSPTLTFSNIVASDFGQNFMLRCTASDGCRVDSLTGFTFSATGVLVTGQPERVDRPCTGGAAAVFSVQASGPAPVSYSWRKDGLALSDGGRVTGAASPTLTIASPVAGDRGMYSCLVTSGCGSEESAAALLNIGPPVFTAQPAATHACSGGFIFLGVTALGSEPQMYQWVRDGVDLSDNSRTFGAQDRSLFIVNVEPGDMGSYWVRVHNDCGDSTSSSAAVTPYPAVGIAMQPASRVVCPSGTTTLSVVPAVDDPAVRFQWEHESQTSPGTWVPMFDSPLATDQGDICANVTGPTTRTLTLAWTADPACGTSAHRFRCRVFTQCEFVRSNPATVAFCKADYDCSGNLAVADIFVFLNAWFAGNPNANFDGINGLQVADIFAFLNAWFTGC